MTARGLDLLVSAAIMAGALFMLTKAMAIQSPAHVFPITVISLTAALAGVSTLRAGLALLAGGGDTTTGGDFNRVLVMIAALIVYTALLPVGYVPVTIAFLFVLYVFLSGSFSTRMILVQAVLAVAIALMVFSAFRLWLGVSLPSTGLGYGL